MALTTSLESYWALGEASGNATDSVGTNTLTDNNSVGSAAGKIGNARSFAAASSQYLSHTDNASLSTGDIDFTVAFWHKATTLNAGGYGLAGTTREYIVHYDSSRFKFYVSSNGALTASAVANNLGAPSTATWYYIVAWHDSVNNLIGISVNDGTADTASYSSGVFDSTSTFMLGRNADGGNYADGLFDEFGFWKRVLTSGERTSLYNGGSGLAYPFSGNRRRRALICGG